MTNQPVPTTAPETKVTVATAFALVTSVIISILNAFLADSTLLGNLHPTLQAIIIAAIPPLIVFGTAYAAPHTPRAYRNTDDRL